MAHHSMTEDTALRIDQAVSALRRLEADDVPGVSAIIDRLVAVRKRYCNDPGNCASCPVECRPDEAKARLSCAAIEAERA